MWLVNLSEKDIECLYYNRICYDVQDKVQAMQFQNVTRICYAYDINSGKMWETKWRELERKEFLRDVKNEERIAAIMTKASIRRFQFMNKPIPTDKIPMSYAELNC
ncbi:hypothetical protein Hanom_Chr11g01022711 [Helianthus anomalus]